MSAPTLALIFQGHIPSKKNSLRRVFSKGRTLQISSAAHEKWEKAELKTLIGVDPIQPPYRIEYRFYPGSLMGFDMSNSLESLNDLLVKAGILADDGWKVLRDIHPRLMGLDFENPRVEVDIHRLEETAFDEALRVLGDKDAIRHLAKARGTTQKAIERHYRAMLRSA